MSLLTKRDGVREDIILTILTILTILEVIMPHRITMKIEGMHCSHCKNNVEKALKNVSGVWTAFVNLGAKEAIIEHDDAKIEDLKEAVTSAGYQVIGEPTQA